MKKKLTILLGIFLIIVLTAILTYAVTIHSLEITMENGLFYVKDFLGNINCYI